MHRFARAGFLILLAAFCAVARPTSGSQARLDRANLLIGPDSSGAIRPVESIEDWEGRRQMILRGMFEVMGAVPEASRRVPLDVQIEEESGHDGYVRHLITYQSEPGSRVPAYLLVPNDVLAGERKAAAVLCLHPTDAALGHKVSVGLGGRPGRAYAKELAERGFVTIAPAYPLLANYHPDLAALGYASGSMKAVWDNMRALDVLEGLPFVRTNAFGVIGHSLGGHNAIFTAALDERIGVLVSSCGFDSFIDYMDGNIAGWTSGRYMPRLLEYSLEEIPFDFHELIGALAPREVLVSAPRGDTNFKWQSVERIIESASQVYALHGVPERLRAEYPDAGHDFPDAIREKAYRLFDRVLNGGDEWQTIGVPGAWEEAGLEAARDYDGFAWYRTWVRPHDSFFTRHARNLFEESVTINIRELADAHEVYVNGTPIGEGGRFPPEFESGRGLTHRHKVPPGTLHRGQWNEIAVRVYNQSGPGGFVGEAPFIMNYFWECVLEGKWQFRLGDDPSWAGEALEEQPEATAFHQYRESSGILGEAAQFIPGPSLPPEESHAKMQAADDLTVELLLHEPLVAQPNHFSYDERGRLWIAQYRQYPYPAGLKMISRDKYYRAHYDRVPPAPPHHDRGRDIVSIHEDTTGDGQFDTHKIFLDGLNMANAVLPGRGGVWVMHTPYLLFYPDADFDDIPDGPPEVRLQGFGLEDTHSVANGLAWGVDGWLYGAQGSTTSSRVTRPGIDPPDAPGVYFEGCMVWRYHPETRAYEIFAEGSGNIFGLEIDAQGRLYSGHNGADTRGWHYVQGGFYLKQGVDPGKFGPPRHPYAFGELPMMRTATRVVRFSHLGAFVEGTAFPEKYAGNMFALDPLHNVVIAVQRNLRGATFETSDLGNVLRSEDVAFRPVYIANAPDGALHIADFYNYYIAHGQHYQSQIDPTTGRIYRLRGKDSPLEQGTNLASSNTDELIALLSHPNKWHRHTAVRLLGERRDPDSAASLKQLIQEDQGVTALCALWALDQSAGLDEELVLRLLQHPYAPVRKWTVRLAGDKWGRHPGLGLTPLKPQAGELPSAVVTAIARQAAYEPDPEVRSQIAASARRLTVQQTLQLTAPLLERNEDVEDPYIPLLCWWAIEHHAARHADEILTLLRSPALWDQPLVFEHFLPRLMRRYALEGRRQDLLVCAQLFDLAPAPSHAAQLMKGLEEAYRGRSMANLPEELLAVMDALGQSPLIVRLRRGEAAAIEEALQVMQSADAAVEERLLYTRAFGQVPQEGAGPVLLALATSGQPNALRRAAFAALGAHEEEAIGAKVIEALPRLPEELQSPALALLTSRASWTLALLHRIQSEEVSPALLSPDMVDRMRLHSQESVQSLVRRLFPETAAGASAEVHERIIRLEAVLKGGPGNPYSGEAIYMQRCGACHTLFHKGGNIGPDLTSYQRESVSTMLLRILDPNAEIREGYEYYLVQTEDGRMLSGFLVERDNRITVLRGMEGEDILLRQEEIKELTPMGRSLMPAGLIDDLDEQELRDLFAYLRISQPITR